MFSDNWNSDASNQIINFSIQTISLGNELFIWTHMKEGKSTAVEISKNWHFPNVGITEQRMAAEVVLDWLCFVFVPEKLRKRKNIREHAEKNVR